MPAKEIKELRSSGKLDEALAMAKAELEDAISKLNPIDESSPLKELKELANNAKLIWPKRNISWVYYDFLKQNAASEHFDAFISFLDEINKLQLPVEEKIFFEQLSWQVGKMTFALLKAYPVDVQKSIHLFEAIESLYFPKPSEGYSFLFKGLHKALKDTDKYLQFADWWDFQNFRPEDFEKEIMPNGKEVMSLAEQAYIAYARRLLLGEKVIVDGLILHDRVLDHEKIQQFIPHLDSIIENYPSYQYPAYFKAKLLLASGDEGNVLKVLLPFAKKKKNDFWVWDILAEAYSTDPEKVLACYCKALTCNSPEEMLVSLRQKIAAILLSRMLYKEAKTEVELLVNARNTHGFKIPSEVVKWQSQDWYKDTTSQKSNSSFYNQYTTIAESLLFGDTPEETVIVEFVNSDRKILNFIASESKFGFFKYDRFFKDVKIGDVLKVRFQGGSKGGIYKLYTAIKANDDNFKEKFFKEIEGQIKIPLGKPFGFLDNAFIHPSMVSKFKLTDGMNFKGKAMKYLNQEKKQWGWKVI